MSNLTPKEKRKLESLFDMAGGYVLNFSNRTFDEFLSELHIDIYNDKYAVNGDSKAKRMRAFWELESNHLVGIAIKELIEYGIDEKLFNNQEQSLIDDCLKISQRLISEQKVCEADSIKAIKPEKDFELLVKEIRQAIESNEPEKALDRLHTYTIKFVRDICKRYDIKTSQDKPLHSIFGEYVKELNKNNLLESEMTERILKSSISILEKFNEVRNNQSLAHDNLVLNYEESLLIFNHITASIRFISKLEEKIQIKNKLNIQLSQNNIIDDILF